MDIRRHNVVIRTKWLFTPTGTEQLRWDWKVPHWRVPDRTSKWPWLAISRGNR
jgi:hypothetical protein